MTSSLPAPSTKWKESVSPDEAERHAEFAAEIVAIQARITKKTGKPGRAFHRKQVAGIRGELTVLTNLNPLLRQGLFASETTFPCLIRMSNGAMSPAADLAPDIRGLAISVRNVSGPGALSPTTDRQDFLLINRPIFGFTDSKDFASIVGPAAAGQSELLKFIIGRDGPLKGPVEIARLGKDLLRPFTGFATSAFFGPNPIKFGDYAVRVRLQPRHERIAPLAARDWHADIGNRLRDHTVTYELQAQFFVDEQSTPIEDGCKKWDSPYVAVAQLVLPRQDLDGTEGQDLDTEIENARFDPWAALADHRPLGEVMRARKVAYFASQQARNAE